MGTILKERDFFQGLEVTRTTGTYCFFGKKRLAWSTINSLIEKGEKAELHLSPNTIIDWGNKENVLTYFNSFRFWNTYISGGSSRYNFYSGVVDIKNGLVSHENEYFLPAPKALYIGNESYWNGKQINIPDGKYNVTLLKQENDWYPKDDINLRKNITLNLFILGSKVTAKIQDLKPNNTELWASQYGDGINFNYHTSTWDGMSFNLDSFNPIKFFTKYFVKQCWGSDVNIEISDSEIGKLMYPIENQIIDVLRQALFNREIHIDIDDSYGEISVPNMLKFESQIAEKVFNIVTEHLK